AFPRPVAIAFLWVYCSICIQIGLMFVVSGVMMPVLGKISFGWNNPEANYIGGGLLVILCLTFFLSHSVPFSLKRNEASWRIIRGFLIGHMVLWALTFAPVAFCLIPLLGLWVSHEVKEYYGVPIPSECQPRRRARHDDAWEDAWDRPGE